MTKPLFQKFDDGAGRVVYGGYNDTSSASVWIVPGTWTELHEIAQDEMEG